MRDRRFLNTVRRDKAGFAAKKSGDALAEEKKKALMQLAAEKKIIYRPGMIQMLVLQARYMGARECALQAPGFFLLTALISYLQKREIITGVPLVGLAAVWIIFSTVFFVAGLSAVFSNHMGELEAACYFNLGQLVCVRLILGGAGQMGALAVLWALFTDVHNPHTAFGMYLVLVWLAANTVYFFVFAAVRGKGQILALSAAALLLAFCAWLPLLWENLLMELPAGVCAVFLVVCLALLGGELAYIFRGIEKGEFVCFD